MKLGLRIRLSLMMFLQYAIWGAWAPVLYPYLVDPKGPLALSAPQASWVFGALWLACIIAPFIGGQIVDRWLPTQYFLAGAHLVGGVLLFLTVDQVKFSPLMLFMCLYCLVYAPTLALTNSLAFHHMDDADKQFGGIRVWGTVGWIMIGWFLTAWRGEIPWPISSVVPASLMTWWSETIAPMKADALRGDCLKLAAFVSIIMGVFCLFLPHTPPKKKAENPWAFMEAISLLKVKDFAIFMAICFVVTTELQFYYMPTAQFLQDIGVNQAAVPAVMTIAQIAELFAMALLLPLALPRLGVRMCLAIGVVAWPLRYIVFAIGEPLWLVKLSLTLHGLGYTFFFVVSQIYVDRVAPRDIRASAQSLLTLITLGLGNFLGTQFTGFVLKIFKTGDQTRWTPVFLVPCALTFACAIAFLIFFKDRKAEAAPDEKADKPADAEKPDTEEKASDES